MVAMQNPLQAAVAAQLTDENIASKLVGRAVEAATMSGIGKYETVVALLAWAESVARSTDDPQFWAAAFQQRAEIFAKGLNDGH